MFRAIFTGRNHPGRSPCRNSGEILGDFHRAKLPGKSPTGIRVDSWANFAGRFHDLNRISTCSAGRFHKAISQTDFSSRFLQQMEFGRIRNPISQVDFPDRILGHENRVISKSDFTGRFHRAKSTSAEKCTTGQFDFYRPKIGSILVVTLSPPLTLNIGMKTGYLRNRI